MIFGNIASTLPKLQAAKRAGFLFEYSAYSLGKPATGIKR